MWAEVQVQKAVASVLHHLCHHCTCTEYQHKLFYVRETLTENLNLAVMVAAVVSLLGVVELVSSLLYLSLLLVCLESDRQEMSAVLSIVPSQHQLRNTQTYRPSTKHTMHFIGK